MHRFGYSAGTDVLMVLMRTAMLSYFNVSLDISVRLAAEARRLSDVMAFIASTVSFSVRATLR